jgi:hypothetical protein
MRVPGCVRWHPLLPGLSVGPNVGGYVPPGASVTMHTGRRVELILTPPVGLGLNWKLEPELRIKQPLGEAFMIALLEMAPP